MAASPDGLVMDSVASPPQGLPESNAYTPQTKKVMILCMQECHQKLVLQEHFHSPTLSVFLILHHLSTFTEVVVQVLYCRYHCCLQLLILFTQTLRNTFPINLFLCDLKLLLIHKVFSCFLGDDLLEAGHSRGNPKRTPISPCGVGLQSGPFYCHIRSAGCTSWLLCII